MIDGKFDSNFNARKVLNCQDFSIYAISKYWFASLQKYGTVLTDIGSSF